MADKREELHGYLNGSLGAISALAAGNVSDIPDVSDVSDVPNGPDVPDASGVPEGPAVPAEKKGKNKGGRPKKYEDLHRLSLNVDGETYKYLKAAAYRDSGPDGMQTVNGYINKLIQADIEKNKGGKQ